MLVRIKRELRKKKREKGKIKKPPTLHTLFTRQISPPTAHVKTQQQKILRVFFGKAKQFTSDFSMTKIILHRT